MKQNGSNGSNPSRKSNKTGIKRFLTLKNIGLFLIALLILLIAERLITQRTFLGYKIGGKDKNTSLVELKEQPSYACDKASKDKVSSILSSDVERIAGIFPDRQEPTFISSCSYRTLQKPSRSVTIVIKETKDEEASREEIKTESAKEDSEMVSDLGDEAVYNKSSRKLTVRNGNKILTVTTNKESESSPITSKELAIEVAKEVVSNY